MTDIAFASVVSVGPRAPSAKARHVAAVVAGNALEFYDFVIYTYFAVYIGRTFFPAHGPASSLLLSLATFGAGFLTRPVGAVVIGAMGDKVGRKPAMMLTFALMGISLLGLSLTPSYAAIGVAAPILVLAFRLLQGFALGGEVGPSTAFLVEAAPVGNRAFYVALQPASQNLAQLIGGGAGTVLAALLDAQQLQDWGWRVAMLLGAAIVPFGLALRRSLPETLHIAEDRSGAAPVERPSVPPWRWPHAGIVTLGLMMITAGTVGTYVNSYMTTYALTILGLPATAAFGVVIIKFAVSIPFVLLGGWLADRFGRKPVMIAAATLLLISILPAFSIVVRSHALSIFYAANIWLTAVAGLASAPIFTTLIESLPKRIRSGVMGMVYALAVSIFGGSTQFVLAWLLEVTKNPLVPAFYWIGALTIGLTAMLLVEETAPRRRLGEAV
jgi:MFS family permease